MNKYIDLEEIIREENYTLYKKLKTYPLLIFSLMKFLLKEKALNSISNRYSSRDLIFVKEILQKEFKVDWTVHGTKKINPAGRYIFVANHYHGGIDGLLFLASVNRVFSEVKIVVNRALLKLEKLRGVFLPVSVFSSFTREQKKQLESYLDSPHPLLIFPAGSVARKRLGDKQLIEGRWKKSFLELAEVYKRDVVPTFIDIQNSFWFYSLSIIRSQLKIKSNLELLLLPRELFLKKNQHINIFFSDPISYRNISQERKKRDLQSIADDLQAFVTSRFNSSLF